jgi:hypothetical protein
MTKPLPKYGDALATLPKTKREFRRALHEAWQMGVFAAQERLLNQADRDENSNYHHAESLREAADLLNGVSARGR